MSPQLPNIKHPFQWIYLLLHHWLKDFKEVELDEMRCWRLKPHSLCLADMRSENEERCFSHLCDWTSSAPATNQDPLNAGADAEQPYSFQNLWRPLWSSLRCSAALYRLSRELTPEKSLSGADPVQPFCTKWKMGQRQRSPTCTSQMCRVNYCGHLHRMKPCKY